jgi:hypothetical protein
MVRFLLPLLSSTSLLRLKVLLVPLPLRMATLQAPTATELLELHEQLRVNLLPSDTHLARARQELEKLLRTPTHEVAAALSSSDPHSGMDLIQATDEAISNLTSGAPAPLEDDNSLLIRMACPYLTPQLSRT